MSTREKRKSKILAQPPRNDIPFKEMETFLLEYGFKLKNRNSTGSHRIYEHEDCTTPINIQSQKGVVKLYQVKQVQKVINELMEDNE